MKNTSELMESLNVHFGWNKARMTCFSNMLLGLFAVRTVNLQEIATAFSSRAKIESRYKRLYRFFALFKMDLTVITRWVFKLFFSEDQPIYLVVDRTNWYWGKQKINIFMLSVAYEGIAIPLFWKLLDKAGNTKDHERQELVNRFTDTFGKARIAGLLADREFASGRFFKWLMEEEIPFYLRIKSNANVSVLRGNPWHADRLFKDLNPKTQGTYVNYVTIYGQEKLRLAGARSERGELMIVVTNRDPRNAIPIYMRRWEIENLFQSLKGRGFRFEETHMSQHDRIEKLMALLMIGFCWAHKVGEWRAVKSPIRMKRFRANLRPQNSFFRYGFDLLRDTVLNPAHSGRLFRQCLRQITLPVPLQEGLS